MLPAKAKRRLKKGQRCKCCGSTENLTIDHIVPVAKGGDLRKENRQILCLRCNQDKGILIIDYKTKTLVVEPYMLRLSNYGLKMLFSDTNAFSSTVSNPNANNFRNKVFNK